MDEAPKRFRYPVQPGDKHPNGSDNRWRYGCYFPATDLCVNDTGGRGTGKPSEVVDWIDKE